ncbi:Fc.00g094040.m01.CDS01 [Cosmosporella sp. VM-42]
MQLTNPLVILAALALGAAQARPSPSETTLAKVVVSASEPTSTVTDTPPNDTRAVCSQIFPQPRVFTCDAEGYIVNDSNKLNDPVFQDTVEACADHCHGTSGCASFLFRWGTCQLYYGTPSDNGFWSTKSYSYWYQMECFNC